MSIAVGHRQRYKSRVEREDLSFLSSKSEFEGYKLLNIQYISAVKNKQTSKKPQDYLVLAFLMDSLKWHPAFITDSLLQYSVWFAGVLFVLLGTWAGKEKYWSWPSLSFLVFDSSGSKQAITIVGSSL